MVLQVVCKGVFEVRVLADVDNKRVVKVLPFQKLFELLSHKIEFFCIFVRILFHELESAFRVVEIASKCLHKVFDCIFSALSVGDILGGGVTVMFVGLELLGLHTLFVQVLFFNGLFVGSSFNLNCLRG